MVITVSCSACAASFPVDPNKIPEGGVKVRCSECAHVFRVERPAPEPELAPPPADDEWVAESAPASSADDEWAAESAPASPADDEWAVEREPFAGDGDTDGTEVDGSSSASDAEEGDDLPDWATGLDGGGTADPAPDDAGWGELENEPDLLPVIDPDPLPVMEAQPAPLTEPEPPVPPEPETVPGFSFGKRDPMDKARRLARVLVSDMVMYNSERHQVALSRGTLAEDFEEEIEKSWKEYVDQVGNAIAEGEGRHFWSQALNDILAKGATVF